MLKVNVATLKAELSRFLLMVRKGERITIISHGKEIATVSPITAQSPNSPINWGDFVKEHPPLKLKGKAPTSADLIRKLRDED